MDWRLPATAVRDQVQQALSPKYTIQRELGGGGMSHVFVADERALDRLVVIKVLAEDLAEGMSVERFEREIRLVARLQHPHIVPLFSSGNADGMPYYTMPYVDGESLRSKLTREKTIPANEACSILRDVARALEYAHAHSVIHRDIKPDNVLLSGTSASVADFGIARAVTAAKTHVTPRDDETKSSITRHGMAVGTPAYMSPEQATCSPDVDQRADIYSFGCLAFEMLTGQPPFTKKGAQAMLVAQVVEAPPVARLRRTGIPRYLGDLVTSCLQKDPSARPANAGIILTVLDAGTGRNGAGAPQADTMSSIAVLPFENMSGDQDNDFFSDGISEEIINALTQISGLRVAGRTSSFAFKGTNADLATVGEKLNVETVLEGSLRKSGNRLRITAQLVKISDGYHMWSERFDRDLTDVFEVQDEIASAIASKLKVSMRSGDIAKPPTNDVRAYELFLKGRELYYLPGWQLARAIKLFEQAIELDENFALAHAALADALSLSGYYGLAMPAGVIGRAHEAALRAVELAPGNSDAHHAVALWLTFYGGDRHAAVLEWEKVASGSALRSQVRCSYALFGLGLLSGKWDAAVAEIQDAIKGDPLNGFAHAMLALTKTFARQLDDVVAYARRGVELDPESFWTHLALQRSLHCAGMHDEAQKQGLYTLEISGRHPWALAELAVDYASVGDKAGADAIHEELVARAKTKHIQPSPLALAAAAAGRLDEAIEHCERAILERDAHILWAVRGVWDGWEQLYRHPKWKDVRKGIFKWRPQPALTPALLS